MKKGAIIAAVILISAGVLIFVGGLFAGGNLPPVTYEAKSYAVSEPFTDICLDTHEMNIELIPSADGTCFVNGAETEKTHVNVSVENGVLTVTTVDERTWIDRLFMSADQPLQVFLPKQAYRTLTVDSHTGDVRVPGGFSFDSMQITCSTGDVTCGASVSGAVEITASTGDLTLEGVRADTLTLAVSTGHITARDTTVAGDCSIRVSTGRTELTDLTCASLTTEGNTGDLTMKNVIAAETISIKRSTGDVRLEQCDAKSLTIETDTGDVTGSLRSGKVFQVKTDTGRVDVPETTTGGVCKITTDTGDIKITTP